MRVFGKWFRRHQRCCRAFLRLVFQKRQGPVLVNDGVFLQQAFIHVVPIAKQVSVFFVFAEGFAAARQANQIASKHGVQRIALEPCIGRNRPSAK